MDAYKCVCCNCETGNGEPCARITRLTDHLNRNYQIIGVFNETLTLVVGPQKTRIPCLKSLLSYHSEYFDTISSGAPNADAQQYEIELTSESPENIAVFVRWIYTGIINSVDLFPLWVLGHRFRSASFTNEVMNLIFDKLEIDPLKAVDANYVYSNTVLGSKLRRFVKEFIMSYGPLHPHNNLDESEQAWIELTRHGGDLVADVCLEGSFMDWFDEDNYVGAPDGRRLVLYLPFPPNYDQRRKEFLEPIVARPVADFLEGKLRYEKL